MAPPPEGPPWNHMWYVAPSRRTKGPLTVGVYVTTAPCFVQRIPSLELASRIRHCAPSDPTYHILNDPSASLIVDPSRAQTESGEPAGPLSIAIPILTKPEAVVWTSKGRCPPTRGPYPRFGPKSRLGNRRGQQGRRLQVWPSAVSGGGNPWGVPESQSLPLGR